MVQVAAIDAFRVHKQADKGYFFITDTARPPKIHEVTCAFVIETTFTEKVIVNGSNAVSAREFERR